MVKYLIEIGANPKHNNNTIFKEACAHGYLQLVKYLIDYGITDHKNSGLKLAREHNCTEVIEYLENL